MSGSDRIISDTSSGANAGDSSHSHINTCDLAKENTDKWPLIKEKTNTFVDWVLRKPSPTTQAENPESVRADVLKFVRKDPLNPTEAAELAFLTHDDLSAMSKIVQNIETKPSAAFNFFDEIAQHYGHDSMKIAYAVHAISALMQGKGLPYRAYYIFSPSKFPEGSGAGIETVPKGEDSGDFDHTIHKITFSNCH